MITTMDTMTSASNPVLFDIMYLIYVCNVIHTNKDISTVTSVNKQRYDL